MRALSVLALAVGLALVLAVPAGAQESPEEIARRDFIARAEQSRSAGNHQEALELATRAQRIRTTPSLRLLIAQEHEALGQVLDALDGARQCHREAQASTTLNNREQILAGCTVLVGRLEPQVGRILVRAPEPAPAGLRVLVAGRDVNVAMLGVDFPVMPGRVAVEATAEGMAPFRTETEVVAGRTAEVRVVHVRAVAGTPAPAGTTQAGPSARRGGPGAGPWIVGGLGVLAFGAMGLFWMLHGNELDARDAACDATGCDASARDHDASMRTYTLLTNVSLGVGVAGVAAGVLWYVLARPRGERPPRAPVGLLLQPTEGGMCFGLRGGL